MFNKKIKTIAAVLISCILIYGIASARQVCCRDIESAGKPSSTAIACDYIGDNFLTTLPSRHCKTQLRLKQCRNIIKSGFGTGNACCETDHCNDCDQVTYVNHLPVRGVYPLNKNANALVTVSGSKTLFEPYHQSTFFKSSPIYILKQSIVC